MVAYRHLAIVLAGSLALSGCPSDDDDFPEGDDDVSDDDTADDDTGDDDTGDDDTGDDDTGDDDTGDDDATPDPAEVAVDQVYCLDWSTADFVAPPGLASFLATAGVDLTTHPLLLSPTAVDVDGGQIEMLAAQAQRNTCTQDLTRSTVDMDEEGSGSYTSPSFQVGPADAVLYLEPGPFALPFPALVITGDFNADASLVVDSTLTGHADVTNLPGACYVFTCIPCPSGIGDCVDLAVTSATWEVTGDPPLTEIPG